jgi:hypothetical protein
VVLPIFPLISPDLFATGCIVASLETTWKSTMFGLKNIFERKPEHPMGSVREARKLLAELPVDDAHKAFEEITFWLGSAQDAEGHALKERVEVIGLLDEAARGYQRTLSQGYLAASRMHKLQENRLWLAASEFWKRLAAAYLLCIDEFESGAKGAEQIRDDLPVIAVRAMAALGAQNKWLHLRYRVADQRIWGDIGRLFLFAEAKLFVRSLVMPYADGGVHTSVQQELLKILMLEASSPDRLAPAQIELADKLAAHLVSSFVFGEALEECSYCFDLSARKPPARLVKGDRLDAMKRVFGAGAAPQKLELLLQQVETGSAPGLALGESVRPQELLDLLHHLLQNWSQHPPQRKYERKKLVSRLSVVHGISEIRRKIAGSESVAQPSLLENRDLFYQERADLKLYGFVTEKTRRAMAEGLAKAAEARQETHAEGAESWVMENVSECGYGAVIPQLAEDWVKLGALLGLRSEDGSQWGVGVVRRLSRDARMKVYVGIETLAHVPVSVRLRALTGSVSVWDKLSEAEAREYTYALLLPGSDHCLKQDSLLLEPGAFDADKPCELVVGGERRLINLTGMLERGDDFELVGFSEMPPPA